MSFALRHPRTVRTFGTASEHYEAGIVALCMLVVSLLYEGSASFLPGYAFHLGAFLGTWSGLVSVWLTRTENLLCWPWGIVSVLCLGWFFGDIGLPGQQWLNWGFFLAIQLWAWLYWVRGGAAESDLPVTWLRTRDRVIATGAVLGGALLVYGFIDLFAYESHLPLLDALVVSASITAQFLLGRKKVESWLLWLGPVNIASIILFGMVGAYVLTALYVAFFVHAAIALGTWTRKAR